MSKQFVEAYRKRFWNGTAPDALAMRWPRCGYDSAIVLIDAIKRAGTTEGAEGPRRARRDEGFRRRHRHHHHQRQRDATKPPSSFK
jgi:hypothetical protein